MRHIREDWSKAANRHLERHGHETRITHKSYADQGLDREPERHMGWKIAALERDGKRTEIGDHNRGVRARNAERDQKRGFDRGPPDDHGPGAPPSPPAAPGRRPPPEAEHVDAIGQAHDQRPRTPERSPRLHEAAIREVAQSMSAEFANSIKKGREAQAEQKAAGRALGDASYRRKQLQQQIEERRKQMSGLRERLHDWGSSSKWRERHWSERSLEQIATGRNKWVRETVLTSAVKSVARDKDLAKLEKQLKEIGKAMGKLIERLDAAKDNVAKWADREQKALQFIAPAAAAELARRDAERAREHADREQRREQERGMER